jgi:putative membrane protein insertion efficiency factor
MGRACFFLIDAACCSLFALKPRRLLMIDSQAMSLASLRDSMPFIDKVTEAMRRFVIAVIGLYQLLLSPMIGQACRFHPSCSQFAKEVVLKHGVLRGLALAARRIVRCNPWNPGGADPVP